MFLWHLVHIARQSFHTLDTCRPSRTVTHLPRLNSVPTNAKRRRSRCVLTSTFSHCHLCHSLLRGRVPHFWPMIPLIFMLPKIKSSVVHRRVSRNSQEGGGGPKIWKPFFFFFRFLIFQGGGGARPLGPPPPPGHAPGTVTSSYCFIWKYGYVLHV